MTNFDFSQPPKRNLALSFSVAFNLLFLVAIAALLWNWPSSDGPSPEPIPEPIPEDVITVMVEAEVARLMMGAEASEEIVKKIRAGEIKNSNQLYQWAKAYEDKITETAFAEVNKLNNEYLAESDSGWTPEQIDRIEKFQQAKAEAKRKVAR